MEVAHVFAMILSKIEASTMRTNHICFVKLFVQETLVVLVFVDVVNKIKIRQKCAKLSQVRSDKETTLISQNFIDFFVIAEEVVSANNYLLISYHLGRP